MFKHGLKQLISMVLVFCVCVPFGTAFASDAGDVFCVSFDNCIPGNKYVLMLLRSGTNVYSIQDSDLLFIDLYTAAEESMEIAVIYPDFNACDAAVSGTFSNNAASPRKLGSYRAARMPGQMETVEEEAFSGVTFTHVYLGERVETIGARAFADCANLRYVYVPDSVNSIAPDAFQGDINVTIGCRQNSTAYQFAVDNGLSYLLLG